MEIQGQVRVGTCHYDGSIRVDPNFQGFTKIVCLTASSAYGMLSPYCLKVRVKFNKQLFPAGPNQIAPNDEEYDCLMENYYQFSKVYPQVPNAREYKSRFDRTVIWSWPGQVHLTPSPDPTNQQPMITHDYLLWRKSGMIAREPIRYPVGRNKMDTCAFSLLQTEDGSIAPQCLSYLEARKQIYLPAYVKAVKVHPEFKDLQDRLSRGEKLLIIEVDGPRGRSLPYYKEKYGVGDDFIQNETMLVDQRNLDIMLNDSTERFGHGYCLAGALLGIY